MSPSFSPSETIHAIDLTDPFDTAHLLNILLQLNGVISYFDMFSPKPQNPKTPKPHRK